MTTEFGLITVTGGLWCAAPVHEAPCEPWPVSSS
jgi:hypothetical protein